MKGIIWSTALFIWGMAVILGLVFVNRYYYIYDTIANANKRTLKITANYILQNNYQIDSQQAFNFYLENLDIGKINHTRVTLVGYYLNPLAIRVKLQSQEIPFITILSDETVIEEESDE